MYAETVNHSFLFGHDCGLTLLPTETSCPDQLNLPPCSAEEHKATPLLICIQQVCLLDADYKMNMLRFWTAAAVGAANTVNTVSPGPALPSVCVSVLSSVRLSGQHALCFHSCRTLFQTPSGTMSPAPTRSWRISSCAGQLLHFFPVSAAGNALPLPEFYKEDATALGTLDSERFDSVLWPSKTYLSIKQLLSDFHFLLFQSGLSRHELIINYIFCLAFKFHCTNAFPGFACTPGPSPLLLRLINHAGTAHVTSRLAPSLLFPPSSLQVCYIWFLRT